MILTFLHICDEKLDKVKRKALHLFKTDAESKYAIYLSFKPAKASSQTFLRPKWYFAAIRP